MDMDTLGYFIFMDEMEKQQKQQQDENDGTDGEETDCHADVRTGSQ